MRPPGRAVARLSSIPLFRSEDQYETVRGTPIPPEKRRLLVRRATVSEGKASSRPSARLASDKNQVMDELMNQATIPVDYGKGMVALFRDRTQDVHTRNFAVQHIGLYAEALNRRGAYDAASAEAGELCRALEEASRETECTVAAAAFRVLADLTAFDPQIDGRGLERRLVACVGDAAAAPAMRVMAIQVCGERRVDAAVSELRGVLRDSDSTVALRLAAVYALRCMGLDLMPRHGMPPHLRVGGERRCPSAAFLTRTGWYGQGKGLGSASQGAEMRISSGKD